MASTTEAPAGPSSSRSRSVPATAGGQQPYQSTAAATPSGEAAAAAMAAVQRSRSCISMASVISVVPSQAHCTYMRHILVAVDNSSNSVHALQWAVQHMWRVRDKLHLVHVVPEPPTLHPWPGVFVPPDDALEREEFKEAAAMLEAAFAPLIVQHSAPCDAHLIVAPQDPGSIVNILLDKQEELDASAVVVAPHGKSGLSEWWLGSVTKGLLQHCPVPVVVVPPNS